MKKSLFISLLFLLILAAVTVPSKIDYTDWLKDKIKQQSNSTLVSWGVDILGSTLINSSTSCSDFVFWNVCKTKITDTQGATVIGFFKNFVPISLGMADSSPATAQQQNLNQDRIYIRNFETNKQLSETIEWKPSDADINKTMPINLIDRKAILLLGRDHPNGFKFDVIFDNEKIALPLPLSDEGEVVFDQAGELKSKFTIQATAYNFDDKTSGNKIIIAISDNSSVGMYWIFSYTPVGDLTKINPFHLETSGSMQNKIWIDKNKLLVPIGGNNRIETELDWINKSFYKK